MALTVPVKAALPAKIQADIDLAVQKVAVLKEQEIAIARSKKEIEKETARLSITKDTLEAELPSIEAAFTSKSKELETLGLAIETASEDKNLLDSSIKSGNKELKEAEELRDKAIAKRSEVMISIREKEAKLEADLAAFAEKEAGFELRKKQVSELLLTI